MTSPRYARQDEGDEPSQSPSRRGGMASDAQMSLGRNRKPSERELALEPVAPKREIAVRQTPKERKQALEYLDKFRSIYLNAARSDRHEMSSVIGVTSAAQGEGRTTVALGVAAAMAADLERPVVLIETDLEHPGLHAMLGLDPVPGLAEYLRRECDLRGALRQISPTLFVLPAGDARADAGRLIHQLVNADLPGRLDSSGAMFVLDLPPILDTSYGVLASRMAESLIFVVRTGKTEHDVVLRALERLGPGMVNTMALNGDENEIPPWLRNLAKS